MLHAEGQLERLDAGFEPVVRAASARCRRSSAQQIELPRCVGRGGVRMLDVLDQLVEVPDACESM
jgi:hypothetical protein